MHVLRALEYQPSPLPGFSGRLLAFRYQHKNEWIGQQPYSSPTVFNFFLPEYQPPGPVSAVGLVSPEAQLATTPMIVSFLNGMVTLVRDGLSSCRSGFGSLAAPRTCGSLISRRATADGNLTFAPESSVPSEVVDELGLLLTAGRLSNHSKALMVQAYTAEEADGGEPLTLLNSLLLAAPEFHATNHLSPPAAPRPSAVRNTGMTYLYL